MRWPGLLLLFSLSACGDQTTTVAETYPDMQSREFHVFSRHCSACHAPPQPTVHTAAEWPGVIARMQSHRVQRGLGPIMAGDKVMIRDYLAKHAGKEGG